jgi:hypothetical protein
MNGGRRPTTALNSTKSEQKDGMISVARSNISKQEIRYSFSTLVFVYLVMVSLEASGKAPFLVLNATDHDAITLQDDDGNVFKANGQGLKIFLEPKIPELEEVDVYELTEIE